VRRSWKKTVCALAAVASTLAAPSIATANPAARLVYSRTADADACPDESALRRAVAARVGYDAFFPWATRTIVATIAKRGNAYVASVDLVDEAGIRHGGHELRADGSCADLFDAMALAVAIAIDPQVALVKPTNPPEAPPPPPTSDQTLSPPPPTEKVSAPVASPEQPAPSVAVRPQDTVTRPIPPPHMLGVDVSAGATGAMAIAPSFSFGGTVGAALRWRSISLGFEGFASAPASRAAIGAESESVSSWALLATLLPCVYLGPVFG
jgi:hypothetical protein